MSTTRRGFLRMIGLGAAAVAVGPTIMRAIPAPKLNAVTKYRKVDDLNNYFENAGRRMSAEILKVLSATNPFMELIDGQKRPLAWYTEQRERDLAEIAEYHRDEQESQQWFSQVRGWYPPSR